ncbi:MAG: hypothetical protein ACOYN8_06440 [Pseudanabaena sp.]|jgi:hypothetical protein
MNVLSLYGGLGNGDRFPEKMSGKDVLPVLDVLNWQVTVDDVFNLLCLE